LMCEVLLPTESLLDIRIRSIIVPTNTSKPKSTRITMVAIAPPVRRFCPFAGSFEQTRLSSLTLLFLKSVWIKETTDCRSHDDGTQSPKTIASSEF
jgi:hypothetical protein